MQWGHGCSRRNFSRQYVIYILSVQAIMDGMETKKDSVDCVGFPSPAAPYLEGPLDLNEYLIKHPAATFFVRVNGDAMTGAGIHPGDLLIVDRSLKPAAGRVVIAVVNGEFIVRRLRIRQGRVSLLPENPDYPPIDIEDGAELEIWGVVTTAIHSL
jgi:DNA polymerase V